MSGSVHADPQQALTVHHSNVPRSLVMIQLSNSQWNKQDTFQSRLIGSSFDVPSKLRATSARRSSLSGAILLEIGFPEVC